MGKSGYLAKQQEKEKALIEAGIAFGRERIDKVMAGILHYDKLFEKAYTLDKEADVAQEKLDDALREVYGDEFIPFSERQPDVLQPKYNKSRKGWV